MEGAKRAAGTQLQLARCRARRSERDGASRTVERLVSFAHSGCDYLRDATGDDATLAAHFGRIVMAAKHTLASATYQSRNLRIIATGRAHEHATLRVTRFLFDDLSKISLGFGVQKP